MAKIFTEKETAIAKQKGCRSMPNYSETQAAMGVRSGLMRRIDSTNKALSGRASRRTTATACFNIQLTMLCLEAQRQDHHIPAMLAYTMEKLSVSLSPMECFLAVMEKCQRWQNKVFHTLKEYEPHIEHPKNPWKKLEQLKEEVTKFAESLIKEAKENRKFCTNLFNSPYGEQYEESIKAKELYDLKSGSCTRHISLFKRTFLRLPAELYSSVRTIVSKMLPHDLYMKTIAKLRDCFFRNDIDRFNYIFSEASKGRSIFQNIGKSTKIVRAKNVLVIDAKAGQRCFLEQYGIASDAKCGLIFA